MMKTPQQYLQRLEEMKTERQPFARRWQDLAEILRPIRAEFNVEVTTQTQGQSRTNKIFDSTPVLASENFGAGVYGMMTSPANKWFALKTADPELMEFGSVKLWLDAATNRILDSFAPGSSRFYNVIPSLYVDIAVFGTGVFYTEERSADGRIFDSARPLSECYLSQNEVEEVDTCYRVVRFTARQAVQKFGEKISSATQNMARMKPGAPVEIVHCVEPNEGATGRLGQRGRAFTSVYIERGHNLIVRQGGYDEFPFMCPRWAIASGETYGRGPGELAHPDIRMLNAMKRSLIEAAQKAANPPLLAPDEGAITAARTYPGGITYGGVDGHGRPLIHPLLTGANFNLSLEMIEQVRQQVRDAFFFSQLQMVGQPNRTATEVMVEEEQKLRLMAPNLGRLQAEFLSPLIKRRFSLLMRAGALPPPPDELAGQTLDVEYVSPLAKAQKSGEATAVMQLWGAAGQMGAVEPSVFDNLDADQSLAVVAEGLGVPHKVLRTKEAMAERRAQREQQQQAQMALAMGQQGADIVNKIGGGIRPGAGAQQEAA